MWRKAYNLASIVCLGALSLGVLTGCGGEKPAQAPVKPAAKVSSAPDVQVDPPLKVKFNVVSATLQKLGGASYKPEKAARIRSIVRYKDKLVYADGEKSIKSLNVEGPKAWPDKDTFKKGLSGFNWGIAVLTVDKKDNLYFTVNDREVRTFKDDQAPEVSKNAKGNLIVTADGKQGLAYNAYLLYKYELPNGKLAKEEQLQTSFKDINSLVFDTDNKAYLLGNIAKGNIRQFRWGTVSPEGKELALYGSDDKDSPAYMFWNMNQLALTSKYVVVNTQYWLLLFRKDGTPEGRVKLADALNGNMITALCRWDDNSLMLAVQESGGKEGYQNSFYQLSF
jgi:hypothetical protein